MTAALIPVIEFIVKILVYFLALKVRKLSAQWLTAVLCAGSSLIVGLIPFPLLIQFVLTISIAGFFIVKNTDADPFPDGIGIPMTVEIIAAVLLSVGARIAEMTAE